MNFLTIVAIAVLLLCAYVGHRRGLIKSAVGLISVVISLLAAVVIAPVGADLLVHNPKVTQKVQTLIEEKIFPDEMKEEDPDRSDQAAAIQKLPLPEVIKNSLLESNNLEAYVKLGVETFREYLMLRIVQMLLRAGVFAVVFLVCRIVMMLIAAGLNVIGRLPIIRQMNRAAGLLLGLVNGVLLLWLLALLLMAFAATDTGQMLLAQVEESPLLSALYNHNLLLDAILNVL